MNTAVCIHPTYCLRQDQLNRSSNIAGSVENRKIMFTLPSNIATTFPLFSKMLNYLEDICAGQSVPVPSLHADPPYFICILFLHEENKIGDICMQAPSYMLANVGK